MKKIIIFILLLSSTSCVEKHCRLRVELISGEKFDSEFVTDYVSGVSNIKKCNGENLIVNTSDIKKVKY